ncbi:MAG: hypothetical protein NVSMB26_14350 [Beijerinckiaceae bacterium]
MGGRGFKDGTSQAALRARTRPAASPGAMKPAEASEYIKDLAAELATLAAKSRLPLLAYLLDMVRSEAASLAQVQNRYRGNGAGGSNGEMSATRSPP